MDLIHNMPFRVTAGEHTGLYRTVAVSAQTDEVAAVKLDPSDEERARKGGAPRKADGKGPKVPRKSVVTQLRWFTATQLASLSSMHLLTTAEIKRPSQAYRAPTDAAALLHKVRTDLMADFLNVGTLQESVVKHRGWSDLVAKAMRRTKNGRTLIYKLVSLLCRRGFNEASLRPDLDRCGAPGKKRPVDPKGRLKPGRKTRREKIALEMGEELGPPAQPGMSSVWTAMILSADEDIKAPKPPMTERVTRILKACFSTQVQEGDDGKLKPQLGPIGTYPNRKQIIRVLDSIGTFEKIINSTTTGHYNRTMRGLGGKSYKGVSGPGHTYAIDSTIGDVYLRSSINRAWIIGRPIVYVIVDVWSTAVVGFYVCLAGPSWDMAKISIFNACMPQEFLGQTWGYANRQGLFPQPTLPAVLLCDRGEYLSQAASQTALKCRMAMSYTPPYRPDLKGIVEVLHRIAKDAQYYMIPGAIDARRKELELRRFEPWRSALTIREFVHFLHVLFTRYNFSADRSRRMEPHMIAAGVAPTPAGLWRWGHEEARIGFRRHQDQDDLIRTWLPNASAVVTGRGIHWDGRDYGSDDVDRLQWTTLARNRGAFEISTSVYPGSVHRIWTPNGSDEGLLELSLTAQGNASGECTLDEIIDAHAVRQIDQPHFEHERSLLEVDVRHEVEQITKAAVDRTREAEERAGHEAPPTMTEARELEREVKRGAKQDLRHDVKRRVAASHAPEASPPQTADQAAAPQDVEDDNGQRAYLRAMERILGKKAKEAA